MCVQVKEYKRLEKKVVEGHRKVAEVRLESIFEMTQAMLCV